MSTTTRTPSTFVRENWRLVAVAVLLVATATATITVVATTPSTDVPVGIVESSGISMSPTFGTHGIALYVDGELEQGDVVVFYDRSSDRYMMHRIVGETEQGFETQGDAYESTDQSLGRSYVTSETRVGEVWLRVDAKGVHLPAF